MLARPVCEKFRSAEESEAAGEGGKQDEHQNTGGSNRFSGCKGEKQTCRFSRPPDSPASQAAQVRSTHPRPTLDTPHPENNLKLKNLPVAGSPAFVYNDPIISYGDPVIPCTETVPYGHTTVILRSNYGQTMVKLQ